jgi:hypothetical protein
VERYQHTNDEKRKEKLNPWNPSAGGKTLEPHFKERNSEVANFSGAALQRKIQCGGG